MTADWIDLMPEWLKVVLCIVGIAPPLLLLSGLYAFALFGDVRRIR